MNFFLNNFAMRNLAAGIGSAAPFVSDAAIAILVCILSVALPCFLVGTAFAIGNEHTELFNSGSVAQKFSLDEPMIVGAIVVPVMAGEIDHRQGGRKGGAQPDASGPILFDSGKFGGEPVRGECANKCTDDCKTATNQRNVVSSYVFHGTKLQFWGAALSGLAIAVLLIITRRGPYTKGSGRK